LCIGKRLTGFSEPDVGEPPDVECDVVLMQDGLMSSELETTWLTDKEIRHGCCVAECSNKSSSQQSMQRRTISWSSIIAIQMARSKLSESDRWECINVDRLWLEIGKTYSWVLEYDSAAAIHSAGPEASRRIGNWALGRFANPTVSSNVVEWNSGMDESMRHVLRRWRGVCSFSQTMRSTWSDEESHLVYDLRSGNNVGLPVRQLFGGPARGLYCGPARLLPGGEHDKLKSYSMALKI
jgi:hypothetical protein